MNAATLKRPIERLAYRRPEAAAALGVSETKFADWEQRGMVPRAIVIDGCSRCLGDAVACVPCYFNFRCLDGAVKP